MELPLAVVRATRIRTRRSCARRCRRTRHDRFRVPLPKWAPAARILLPQPGERAVSAGYHVLVAATPFPLWSGHQPDRSRVRSPYYLLLGEGLAQLLLLLLGQVGRDDLDVVLLKLVDDLVWCRRPAGQSKQRRGPRRDLLADLLDEVVADAHVCH